MSLTDLFIGWGILTLLLDAIVIGVLVFVSVMLWSTEPMQLALLYWPEITRGTLMGGAVVWAALLWSRKRDE